MIREAIARVAPPEEAHALYETITASLGFADLGEHSKRSQST